MGGGRGWKGAECHGTRVHTHVNNALGMSSYKYT